MLPKVRGEPRAAGLPDAVIAGVDGRRAAPQVEVVVQHPAARVVVLLRGDGAGLRQVLEGVEQRQVAFGEVGLLHRPVVHFGVDVVGVLAVPGGLVGIVPDALQVGGLPAGTAGADHQVAAVLEEQRDQRRVVARGEGGDALVGGQFGGGRGAEVERHAAEQRLVIANVLGAQRVVTLVTERGEGGVVARLGVGRDVAVVLEVGGAGQDEGGGVGAVASSVASSACRASRGALEADGGIGHLAGHGQLADPVIASWRGRSSGSPGTSAPGLLDVSRTTIALAG